MNNSASFNLLKFVERRPTLNINRIFGIIVLFVIVILSYFFYQAQQFRHAAGNIAILDKNIQQSVQLVQPLLQQGVGNPLAGVLPSNFLANEQGFHAEFEALSHVQVKGLWLTDVVISRNPTFIKITGAMDSADKLNSLLQQLAAQPVFRTVQFIGMDVSKGLVSDIPAKYQAAIKQLKFHSFYHFVIQTTALNPQGARS